MTLKAGEREQLSVFGIVKLAEQYKSVDQRVLCLATYSGQIWMSHSPLIAGKIFHPLQKNILI